MKLDDKYPPIVYLNATILYLTKANDLFFKFYMNEKTQDPIIYKLHQKLDEVTLLISSHRDKR